MHICKAENKDLSTLKQMWVSIFKDSENFADFALNICDTEEIYLVKENDEIASMVIAGVDLYAYGKKGFYIYGLCTQPKYEGKGFATQLMNYVCDTKLSSGYDFAVAQPAQESLFDYYKKLGFDNVTYLRKGQITVKKNLWATASFDTVTAGRFKEVRNKYSEDEIVNFSPKGYEKFAEYVYSEGGSTAENDNAYCLYFENDEKITVRDMFARTSQDALKLLQAVRERTGKEIFELQLSQSSQIFLGEGKLVPHCLVKNLNKELYANLMFD